MDPEMKVRGKPGQKLDDDEDRKNPAYIPRKGLFFEHDVRGHAQEEERSARFGATTVTITSTSNWLILRVLLPNYLLQA